MRPWILAAVTGVAVIAVAATSMTAVVQWQRATAAEERAAELADEVDELADEVAELRAEVEALERALEATGEAAPPDDGPDGEGLEGLLGDLFGDLRGDLGGVSDVPGAACMVPDDPDGLGGLLGGLLGGGEPVPDDPDDLVDLIGDQVTELRELEWRDDVTVDFLDDAAIRARLDELLEEDADPDADDVDRRLLEALGALLPGTDLAQVRRDLLGDAVAGFYVAETGELVVRVPEDGTIRPVDRVTLAHELEHALADQALGLPDRDAIDTDGQLAALAVVEGDATLTMNLWALAHLSFGDQLGLALAPEVAAAQAALDDAPHFVQRELLFPYTAGIDFVCDLYLEAGWGAVDAAYHDLPTTSAEIVFPDRRGEPAMATATLTAPAGYVEARTDTLGLAPLLWLFEAPGGDPERALSDPLERASAWAGDDLTVWTSGSATAVGIALVDGGGGPALCGSVTDWYAAAFPGAERSRSEGATVFRAADADTVVACEGTDVRVAIAPDLELATRIVGGG